MSPQINSKLESIRKHIKDFPTGPGLYFMKGAADQVLYIGKAKNLRARVGSYFQQSMDPIATRGPKIAEMLNKVENVDFLETSSEADVCWVKFKLASETKSTTPVHLLLNCFS